MQIFQINKSLSVVCDVFKTKNGFKHTANLLRGGYFQLAYAICHYYNRTWERYEYETVLKKLYEKAEGSLEARDRRAFKKAIEKGG